MQNNKASKYNNYVSSKCRAAGRYLSCALAAMLIIAQTGCGNVSQGAGSGLAGLGGTAADGEHQPVTKESFYFDTICQITVYGMKESEEASFSSAAEAAITDAFSLCSEYEKLLSKTVEGSDIWNVNHAEGEPVACDSRTLELVQKGIYYGDLSGGAFDITIGKAEALWDFHADEEGVSGSDAADGEGIEAAEDAADTGEGVARAAVLPDAGDLAEAVSHVDYTGIRIDEKNLTLQLTDPEAELDLGGIAKGYIADAVCRQLQENGVTSAIVSLGGNIECIGGKPENIGFTGEDMESAGASADSTGENAAYTDFTIGIEMPYSDRTEIVGASGLQNGTMVTSGVYERYITVDGKRYHHILDVETGYPVDTDVLGVTIKGNFGTSADCDALSTTCLMLGSEKGKALIESMDGYEALFILQDESVTATTGMEYTQKG